MRSCTIGSRSTSPVRGCSSSTAPAAATRSTRSRWARAAARAGARGAAAGAREPGRAAPAPAGDALGRCPRGDAPHRCRDAADVDAHRARRERHGRPGRGSRVRRAAGRRRSCALLEPLHAAIAYGSAAPWDRRSAHRRLAEAALDADERAQQLAVAVDEPDEGAAGELELAATAAARRGAPETAARLAERAAELTPQAASRTVAGALRWRPSTTSRRAIRAGPGRSWTSLVAALPAGS